jgi:uncharacterized repeat protein (TIGR03803 family)
MSLGGKMKRLSALKTLHVLVAAISLGSAAFQSAQAQTETILHSFHSNGKDGTQPRAGLIRDTKGNLYGTTSTGGTYNNGTVFELTPAGRETILHSFNPNGGDARVPLAGVIRDSKGNLYGTTVNGGTSDSGAVFELSPSGAETVLHSFTFDTTDGFAPVAGLVRDAKGSLYGMTPGGGTYHAGVVFKLTPSGTETILHTFNDSLTAIDGFSPEAGLVMDTKGNLYGTTQVGDNAGLYNNGTVFELTPSGTETILHMFTNSTDGANVWAGLVRDTRGNLYGTTYQGGTYNEGTVFEVTASGTETILHSFNNNGTDGYGPVARLAIDSQGNLYGTTEFGGTYTYGTVFELTPSGTETILHSFGSGSDGRNPVAGLVRDTNGNLYGTTEKGGAYGGGTVFEVKP